MCTVKIHAIINAVGATFEMAIDTHLRSNCLKISQNTSMFSFLTVHAQDNAVDEGDVVSLVCEFNCSCNFIWIIQTNTAAMP